MSETSTLGFEHIAELLSENLSESVENIFDERNDNMIDEGIDFVQCLKSVLPCESATLSSIVQETINTCMNKIYLLEESDVTINHFLNMKDNMDEVHIDSNQPLPDVSVFTTLYDKGYIKDSYMQKHITRQSHSLKSTLSNLMGGEWVSRTLRPHTPQTSLNDWIDSNLIFDWNRRLASSKFDELPSAEELTKVLMLQTNRLPKSIADSTYEDMSVNAVMCYEFSALVALITKQELNQTLIRNVVEKMTLFATKFGLNGFFLCCCMVMNLVYAKVSLKDDSEMTRTADAWKSMKNAERFNNWVDEGQSITLPNKDIFPCELSSLLGTLEQIFDFNVTSEDARVLGLPTPILMSERIRDENNDERQNGMILKESVKIGQGLTEVETFEPTVGENGSVKGSSSSLDSLVERLQVESGSELGNVFWETLSPTKIHSAIMENQSRLFHNALRHEYDALKSNLAANLIMMEELRPLLSTEFGSAERTLLERDIAQMEYNNNKYIGVVETGSNESVELYAKSHWEELLSGIVGN